MEALAYIDQGRIANANRIVDKALAEDSDHQRSKILKALILSLMQRMNASLDLVEQVTRISDLSDHLIVTIAVKIYFDAGKIEQAIDLAKTAKEKNPAKAWPYNCIGELMFLLGRYEAAGECFDDALNLENYNCEAAINKSKVNIKLSNFIAAIALLEAVLKIRKDASAANLLGLAHYKLKRYKIAEKILTDLTDEHPNFVSAIINLANVQHTTGVFKEAEKNYLLAAQLDKKNVSIRVNLAKFYVNYGKRANAVREYKAVLDIQPNNYEAILALAILASDEGELLNIEARALAIIDDRTSTDMQLVYSKYALAHSNKTQKNFGQAVHYFNQAGSLNADVQEFDFDLQRRKCDKIQLDYSSNLQAVKHCSSQLKPIFIVGMPRSGTTLLENLLCSHQEIVGFGETDIIGDIFENLPYLGKSYGFTPSEKFSQQVRAKYFECLNERYRTETTFFIDKSPLNFQWLGQIFLSFPEASVIHIKRDPLAVCWSNFSRYFPAKGMSFSNTQISIAQFYGLYFELMDFWKKKFPNRIINVNFEDLSVSPEKNLTSIFQRIGLSWDIAMLSNRPKNNFVGTASSLQVRGEVLPANFNELKAVSPYLDEMKNVLRDNGILHRL